MNPPENTPAGIFARALEHSPGPLREAYLDGACGVGTSLRSDVEALLAMEEDAESFFAPQTTGARTRYAGGFQEPEGSRIGRYKLLQRIGEGGCGVVYLAEQTAPVRRKVALKVLKFGTDTRGVVARFEAERQALALMDHPNIARVLDAGETDLGRPYFVMELVRGTKITAYCEQHHLPLRDRLILFVKVCQAVQHAHQKGIIHRDIKPSNILVTVRDGVAPIPKVIDFGVAKATGELQLTDKTLFTQMEVLVGTPAYMSPEQADLNSSDIDTRSDIYSLGVLLYELITGRPPFDGDMLATSGIDAMRRTIREKEPLPPSTRISGLVGKDLIDLARQHGSFAPRLISMVRGDLDWIVLKALEKDRQRRYQTANALANDVERYLRDEMVTARPPSRAYRLQKLVRRHSLIVASSAAVVLSLVAGLGTAVWQYQEKSHALQRESEARKEQVEQRRVAEARAYASEVRLIQDALSVNNLGRAKAHLVNQLSLPETLALRGWEWRYLWDQCQSDARFELPALYPVPDPIWGLSISADGRFLATTEHGHGAVMTWDILERKALTRLAHNPYNAAVEFSPTQPLLAFSTEITAEGGPVFGISIWNQRESRAVRALQLPGRCNGLAFSADGQQLLTIATLPGNVETEYSVWRVEDGERLSRCLAPRLAATIGTPAAAASDLSWTVHAMDGGQVTRIETATGTRTWTRTYTNAFVDSVAIAPDQQSVALGFRSTISWISIVSATTGATRTRLDGGLDARGGYATDLLFSRDSRFLWSAGSDQVIRLWNIEQGVNTRVLRGHRREVWRLAMMPDQRSLISASKDGQILVWDTATPSFPRERILVPARVWHGWRFSADSKSLLTCDEQGRVQRWLEPHFQEATTLLDLGQDRSDVLFDDHATQVAAADTNGVVRVWDIDPPRVRMEFRMDTGPVALWKFTRAGKGLVVIQSDGKTFREWDLVNGHVLPADAPDRDWHIHGSFPGTRLVLKTGWQSPQPTAEDARKARYGFFDRMSLDGALSPDGQWLAFGHHGGSVHIIDAHTRRSVVELQGFVQGVHSVAFSSDGRRLIAGGDGREAVKMWDTQTRQELITLEGDGTSFFMTALSPDERWLGALSANGNLNLWRASSWEEIARAPQLK